MERYSVIGTLMAQGPTTVLRAMRKEDGMPCAIKQIKVTHLPAAEQRLRLSETMFLSSISSPYVIKHLESFVEGGRVNIVTEYVQRGTLAEFLRQQKRNMRRVLEDSIWRIFLQIALGLLQIHSKNIVHRNICTDNILRDEHDNMVVSDFGSARFALATSQDGQRMAGNPLYRSPEIYRSQMYSDKSDVWALGCIIYECCTFMAPFVAHDRQAVLERIRTGTYYPIDDFYSDTLSNLISLCFIPDHEMRPSIAQLISMPAVLRKAATSGLGLNLPEETLAMARVPSEAAFPDGDSEAQRWAPAQSTAPERAQTLAPRPATRIGMVGERTSPSVAPIPRPMTSMAVRVPDDAPSALLPAAPPSQQHAVHAMPMWRLEDDEQATFLSDREPILPRVVRRPITRGATAPTLDQSLPIVMDESLGRNQPMPDVLPAQMTMSMPAPGRLMSMSTGAAPERPRMNSRQRTEYLLRNTKRAVKNRRRKKVVDTPDAAEVRNLPKVVAGSRIATMRAASDAADAFSDASSVL